MVHVFKVWFPTQGITEGIVEPWIGRANGRKSLSHQGPFPATSWLFLYSTPPIVRYTTVMQYARTMFSNIKYSHTV